jgi:hypothetical protein
MLRNVPTAEHTQSWTDNMCPYSRGNYCLAKPPGSSISDITPHVPGSRYIEPKAEWLTEY